MSTLRLCSLRTPRYFARQGALFARKYHRPAALPYKIEDGLGEFLPPPALKAIAVDYREGLLTRLNNEVRGTEFENMTVVDTIIASAANPVDVLKFNFASLALNNHYFLDTLLPPQEGQSNHQKNMTFQLKSNIGDQYGSLAQLKSTFSAASIGMFSGGYIWLVTDKAGRLAIVPTFGAGTLLIRAREYMHPHDPETMPNLDLLVTDIQPEDPYRAEWEKEMEAETAAVEAAFEADFHQQVAEEAALAEAEGEAEQGEYDSSSPSSSSPTSPTSVPGGRREYHTSSPRMSLTDPSANPANFDATQEPLKNLYDSKDFNDDAPHERKHYALGDVLYPLFCVPVQEAAWVTAGYGVWGQEEWMKKFWTVLDWNKVSQRYASVAPAAFSQDGVKV